MQKFGLTKHRFVHIFVSTILLRIYLICVIKIHHLVWNKNNKKIIHFHPTSGNYEAGWGGHIVPPCFKSIKMTRIIQKMQRLVTTPKNMQLLNINWLSGIQKKSTIFCTKKNILHIPPPAKLGLTFAGQACITHLFHKWH